MSLVTQLGLSRWPAIDPWPAFSMLLEIEIAQARDLVFQGIGVNAVSHDAHRRALAAFFGPATMR